MSDDDYEIPLQDQRVFGAGIKRKRVHFVPATTSSSTPATPPAAPAQTSSVGDRYLSIVLSRTSTEDERSASEPPPTTSSEDGALDTFAPSSSSICGICSLPLPSTSDSTTRPHEASLAHQVCLTHSHPPSHIDRWRVGLRYLKSQGWDPDSRLGLGAAGQGIQYPIKPKVKDDKLGIGVVIPKEMDGRKKERLDKREKLDAGRVRKLDDRDRKRREKLQEMFYRSEDVERYLGGG
jgi:hypothetical protein